MNAKATASRYQRQVGELSRLPGNDTCADCGGRNPRWASHNLGIFICMQCAGVHRKMGTHISKVKSLTLDEWTKEQVERMREYGNIKSNLYFNPDEKRNRPPANVTDSERDSELEKFIRNKYEYRRFMNRLPPPVPRKDPPSPRRPSAVSPSSSSNYLSPSSSGSTLAANGSRSRPAPRHSSTSPLPNGSDINRSRTAPIPSTWKEAQRAVSPLPELPKEASKTSSSSNGAANGTSSAAAPPQISVSSAAGQRSATVSYPHGTSPYTSASGPTTSLSPNYGGLQAGPGLPARASSAQGYSAAMAGPSSATAPARPPMTASASAPSFEGRSAVFDDLISLTKPAPVPQQPTSNAYLGGVGGMGNPWAGMGALQSGMANMSMNGGAQHTGMNPWPQQANTHNGNVFGQTNGQNGFVQTPTGMMNGGAGMQVQPTGYFGQTGSGFAGPATPQDLGSMAFSPSAGQQLGGMGMGMGAGSNPNAGVGMMGMSTGMGMGMGGTGLSSPTNPFFGGASAPATYTQFPQQQQQQQPVSAGATAQMMAQQRLDTGQVFSDWAKGMMPGQKR